MRIEITLTDTSNGHVRVTFNPSLQQLVRDRQRRKDPEMSPAEAYAFLMANAVREASKKLDKYDPKKIITPGDFL